MRLRLAVASLIAAAALVAYSGQASAQDPTPPPAGCVVTSAGVQCAQLPPGCFFTSAGLQCPPGTNPAPAPVTTQVALGEEQVSGTPTPTPTPTSTPPAGNPPGGGENAAPPPSTGVPVLAFTGYDAFPFALVGAMLLAAGLLLRRRSRTAWAAPAVAPALSLPEVPAPAADAAPPSARSERATKLLVGALMLGALLRRGRP
jgi:hypothetical protein